MMNRRQFSSALVASAGAALFAERAAAAVAPATRSPGPGSAKVRNVVLVHGLFADGSCWSEVILGLQAAGMNATAVQNPLTDLSSALAATRRVLDRQDGPTVFVGHSFSGVLVSELGEHPNVHALVYVAARAPDAGEDYGALAKRFPTPPASAGILFDGDVPPEKARVLYAVQQPFNKALIAAQTTRAAWRTRPSFYAVSAHDRTIDPDMQRFMAKRMGATTIEVAASHLSMISHPDEISKLIMQASSAA
jgi:pimeloyl-ACP methyl ester carboxylesterase